MADSTAAKIEGKRATLADVAQVAKVSRMTVSRVVRGEPTVKVATRQKVLALIEELGYHPDPLLSALSAYRTVGGGKGDGSTLVFLDCDGTEYSRGVFEGAQAEARFYGYRIELQRMPKTQKAQSQLQRVLYHRGVRGLLLGPSDHESDFSGWAWDRFAAVSLGALVHKPAMHAVAMDYFQGAFAACRILRGRGCGRIGFAVGGAYESRTGHRWMGGYLAGIEGQSKLCYQTDPDSRDDFEKWCRSKKVDGLLTIHEELLEAWPFARENFLLLNDYAIQFKPELRSLTHLSLNRAAIGAEGMRVLHHHLLRQSYGIPESPKLSQLQGQWRHV
ncbi:LacI family DNA-binding transcriptional regulator [Coraliomargarita parva]|uniref:LacI family DNA-binding transcriptional regulator n=1 Tax=Coraliomargarita parva TaxID=3014050 RepID=UPI0022B43D60|nr:LacI family DNA-binding transcriptional regulator [Coraliomargarita parva]